jgi:hypothetical protein
MADINIVSGGRKLTFLDVENSFKKLYQSRSIDYQDDEAVVAFLKTQTDYPYTHGDNGDIRIQRRILELSYLDDLAENLSI